MSAMPSCTDISLISAALMSGTGTWSDLRVAHVDLSEAAVEEDLGRVELELEAELLIVDELVAAEVEQGLGKVVEGGVVALEEEVGDAALEVSGRNG